MSSSVELVSTSRPVEGYWDGGGVLTRSAAEALGAAAGGAPVRVGDTVGLTIGLVVVGIVAALDGADVRFPERDGPVSLCLRRRASVACAPEANVRAPDLFALVSVGAWRTATAIFEASAEDLAALERGLLAAGLSASFDDAAPRLTVSDAGLDGARIDLAQPVLHPWMHLPAAALLGPAQRSISTEPLLDVFDSRDSTTERLTSTFGALDLPALSVEPSSRGHVARQLLESGVGPEALFVRALTAPAAWLDDPDARAQWSAIEHTNAELRRELAAPGDFRDEYERDLREAVEEWFEVVLDQLDAVAMRVFGPRAVPGFRASSVVLEEVDDDAVLVPAELGLEGPVLVMSADEEPPIASTAATVLRARPWDGSAVALGPATREALGAGAQLGIPLRIVAPPSESSRAELETLVGRAPDRVVRRSGWLERACLSLVVTVADCGVRPSSLDRCRTKVGLCALCAGRPRGTHVGREIVEALEERRLELMVGPMPDWVSQTPHGPWLARAPSDTTWLARLTVSKGGAAVLARTALGAPIDPATDLLVALALERNPLG